MDNAIRRARQVRRVLQSQGLRGLVRRVLRALISAVGGDQADLEIKPEDVADSATIVVHPWAAPASDRLTVAWVSSPPSHGSGGHTTTLRFVEALEAAGHRCVLYLYDRFDGDVARHEEVLRSGWPRVQAEVHDARDGIGRHDAYVATSWPTAHVIAAHAHEPGERFYLVQDFEPYFYPRGSEYALAEDTYRFGFHCLTVGHMVADELERHIGIESVVTEFGCDTDVYALTNPTPRHDVVFYTKPGTPRRGYDLGVLALEQFHRRHPGTTIHTFGSAPGDLRFPVEAHGRLSPAALNELYNTCAAGLALSFTNISLIANELLAAGTIPVVNDSPLTRADLENPHVEWARPTPTGLAEALSRAVERQSSSPNVSAIAASVRSIGWAPAQELVVRAIEQRCFHGTHLPR